MYIQVRSRKVSCNVYASNKLNNPFLKVPHGRTKKRLFAYYAVLALILVSFQLFFTASASALQIGDRVKATENLNVRNCPFLWCDVIGVIPSGGAGKIINGSYFYDNYTWWYIRWDNGLTGYSAQNWLTVIPGTLPGSFTLNQPSTSCNSTNPQISLSWGSSSNATNYKVYRNGAYYDNVYTSLTYKNTSVISGTTYSYFIRASNSAGYRDSNTVTATAPNCVASPQITIGPSLLNFGNVQTGSCGSAQFAVQHVVNTGTASGTLSISQNPPFRVTSNSSFSLSNGQAVNVNVEFCPTSSGSFSGTAVINSNANQNINSVNLSGTGVSPSPTTGVIQVNAKLDGILWSGSVNYSISGAQNFSGNSVSADFQDRPQGNYTLAYVSGGPANSAFSNITPSISQTLNGGGVITFTLNFTSETTTTTSTTTSTTTTSTTTSPSTSTSTSTSATTTISSTTSTSPTSTPTSSTSTTTTTLPVSSIVTKISVPCVIEDVDLSTASSQDYYRFTLSSQSDVTVSLISTDFDTFLILRNAADTINEENDNSQAFDMKIAGYSTNSQISLELSADTYFIQVSGMGGSGKYTLVIRDIGDTGVERICDKIGHEFPAVFPGENWADDSNDWVAVMTKITDTAPFGGPHCVGRCGKGCPYEGFPSCGNEYRYTRDCFNHDACCGYYGKTDDGEGCGSKQCWEIFWGECEADCVSFNPCAGPQYVNPSGTCAGQTPCYSTIQSAMNAGGDGSTIRIPPGIYSENLTSTPATMNLWGGWFSTSATESSTSTVNSLTITDGKIIVDNLVIQ